MCKKLSYCARLIDPCIRERIEYFRKEFGLRTILSCCGHGKYPETIVIRREDNVVYEYYSLVILKNYDPNKKKQYNRYYVKDNEGYYFIPEVMNRDPFKKTLLCNFPSNLPDVPDPKYWA